MKLVKRALYLSGSRTAIDIELLKLFNLGVCGPRGRELMGSGSKGSGVQSGLYPMGQKSRGSRVQGIWVQRVRSPADLGSSSQTVTKSTMAHLQIS